MPIKVIGAGFPRTGTNTLKHALQILGFTDTHHYKDLLQNPENVHYWETLRDTGTTNWEELYNGYEASVDFPCYPWYKEHMQQYPDAKVILSIRTFDSWYNSMKSTLWAAAQMPTQEKGTSESFQEKMKCVNFVRNFLWEREFEGRFEDKFFVKEIWDRHLAEVKSYVPDNKLLVYQVNEGWEPLCDFFRIPIPTQPFPHLNKRADFENMLKKMMIGPSSSQ